LPIQHSEYSYGEIATIGRPEPTYKPPRRLSKPEVPEKLKISAETFAKYCRGNDGGPARFPIGERRSAGWGARRSRFIGRSR
jgi:hypothetical protein